MIHKKINLLMCCFFLLLSISINAQNYYNIRLDKIDQTKADQICYQVQLASAQAADFNLAGQNYRLYYDSKIFRYNEMASKSLLPTEKYTQAILKDNFFDVDAKGVGLLPFEEHLAFINLGLDLKNEVNGGIVLPASGEWQNTLQLCFDLISSREENFSNQMEIYWARATLTDSYATAFVEVAEWMEPNKTQRAIAENYFDINLSTAFSDLTNLENPKVYPNPTKDKVWIAYNKKEVFNLQVWSVTGKLIREQEIDFAKGLLQISLDNQPAGIYQIRLKNERQTFLERVEKIY